MNSPSSSTSLRDMPLPEVADGAADQPARGGADEDAGREEHAEHRADGDAAPGAVLRRLLVLLDVDLAVLALGHDGDVVGADDLVLVELLDRLVVLVRVLGRVVGGDEQEHWLVGHDGSFVGGGSPQWTSLSPRVGSPCAFPRRRRRNRRTPFGLARRAAAIPRNEDHGPRSHATSHDTARRRSGRSRREPARRTRVTFLGHASTVIEMDGVRLVTDPVPRRLVGPLYRRVPQPLTER